MFVYHFSHTHESVLTFVCVADSLCFFVFVFFFCVCYCILRVVRPRLTIYVCQESQQARDQQQKHENGDGASNTFFGVSLFVWKSCG